MTSFYSIFPLPLNTHLTAKSKVRFIFGSVTLFNAISGDIRLSKWRCLIISLLLLANFPFRIESCKFAAIIQHCLAIFRVSLGNSMSTPYRCPRCDHSGNKANHVGLGEKVLSLYKPSDDANRNEN